MSGSASTAAWVLVGLIVTSVAAVGADAVQRGLETVAFETAPLHENERFVYDVTVLTGFHNMEATAERMLEIEVGPADPDDPTFPITVTRNPAPFDVNTQLPWDQDERIADAALQVSTTEHVDLKQGRVAYSQERLNQEQWYGQGAATYRYALDSASKAQPGGTGGLALAFADTTNVRWVHDLAPLGVGQADAAPGALPMAGTYGDRAVYGRNVTTVTHQHHGDHVAFGCDLAPLPFTYEEKDTGKRHARMDITKVQSWTEWRAPDLALPVFIDCHSTYLTIPEGQDIGHIRVVAALVEHDGGDAAHSVSWDDEPVALPEGDREPVGVLPHGVPPDTSYGTYAPDVYDDEAIAFRFPLNAAHDLAHEWLHTEHDGFVGDDDLLALVAASYWPGTESPAPCSGIPDPIVAECSLLPAGAQPPPQAFVEPHWWLTFENGHGERIVAQVLRNMTTTGQVVEDSVTQVGEPYASGHAPLAHALPEHLVPVHEMLAGWLDQHEFTLAQWRQQESARFQYVLDPAAPGASAEEPRPQYRFRHGEVERADNEPEARFAHGVELYRETASVWSYHARDGAVLEKRESAFRLDDHGGRPVGPTTASYQGPTPAPYRPTAAIVIGVVGLGAFAVGATPSGRGWIRGLLALPLFTKLNKNQVLEHRTRDSMLSYVKANPGVGTEEIRRHLDIGWGTAVYHLSALEQNGLLSSMRRGGNRHWFAAGQGRTFDREAVALLRSPAARRLHEAVRRSPGRTQQELAAELGVTHGAVIFQVRKLERVGLIRKERDGRFVRYFAATAEERMHGQAS